MKLNEPFRHENLVGLVYTRHLVKEVKVGDYKAVVPTVCGQSWIYGFNTYVLDPTDPFPEGFTVGDIW